MRILPDKIKKKLLPKNKKKLSKKDKQRLILCLPVIIHLFIFKYLPMGGIVLAFKDFRFDKGILGSDWVGFENFNFFFQSEHAWRITRNTVGLNFIFIITGLFVSVTIAIIMFEISKRLYVKIYQTTLILPHFLSWVVVGYMTYALFHHSYGILNKFLSSIGMESIMWYFRPEIWPFILMFISVWKGMGMSSIIYYAALMGQDKNLFDAAAIDGASKWQEIRYIKIPLLIPIMTILTILAIGNIFRADFGLFYQIPRNMSVLYPTTDVIDTFVFRALKDMGDIGMSAAVGLYQSVVGFILILTTNAIVRKIDEESALY